MAEEWYDPKDFDGALDVALRAARADPNTDTLTMGDFVYSSAHRAENTVHYRPFEAAASWLGSDAYRLSKAKHGVTFTDNFDGVKAELRARQHGEDQRFGLLENTNTRAPGYMFPGVVR